jgi:hypothetical protein
MSNTRFTPPTPEQRRTILAEYGIKFDRRIRESECFEITSLSRSTRWYMEEGKFPPRCHFGRNSCAWLCQMFFGGFAIHLLLRTSHPYNRKSA